MLTKRRVIVLLCVLVLLGGCAWVYELRFAPYVAEAELIVQPRSDLDLLFDGHGSAAANEDQSVIAQNMSQLIRSRTVIAKALDQESIKNHPLIREQAADPEGFVASRLEVEVKQPSLIVVRMRERHDPALCADIVNAIVDAFVEGMAAVERSQKLGTISRLEKHLTAQTELEKKKRADLEALCTSLGPRDGGRWALVERMKVEVEQLKQVADRIREKLLDFRLSDAEVGGDGSQARSPYVVPLGREVGGMINPEKVWLDLRPSDWVITLSVRKSDSGLDREARLARYKRYEEEYRRCMADLEEVLGQLAAAQPALPEKSSGSFELDTRQHEIDLLREQIDDLCRLKSRAELTLESGARVEVISEAVRPVSRRHWFAWRSDAE